MPETPSSPASAIDSMDVSQYKRALDLLKEWLDSFGEERETSTGSSDSLPWEWLITGGEIHSAIEAVQSFLPDGKLPFGNPHAAWLRLQKAGEAEDTATAEEQVVILLNWIDEEVDALESQESDRSDTKKRRKTEFLKVHEMLDKEGEPSDEKRDDFVKRYNKRWAKKPIVDSPGTSWPHIDRNLLGQIIRNRRKRVT